MQDLRTRAAAALKLLRRAVVDDDQDSFDFLLSIAEAEDLHEECVDDDGERYATFRDFAEDLVNEDQSNKRTSGAIHASAGGGGSSPFKTAAGAARHAMRMAQLGRR